MPSNANFAHLVNTVPCMDRESRQPVTSSMDLYADLELSSNISCHVHQDIDPPVDPPTISLPQHLTITILSVRSVQLDMHAQEVSVPHQLLTALLNIGSNAKPVTTVL